MAELLSKVSHYEAPNAVDGGENQQTGTDRQEEVFPGDPMPFTSPQHDVLVEKAHPLPCDTLPESEISGGLGLQIITESGILDLEEVQGKVVEGLKKGIPVAELIKAAPNPETADAIRRQIEFADNPAEGNAWQRFMDSIINNPLVTPAAQQLRLEMQRYVAQTRQALNLPYGITAHVGGETANGLAMYGSPIDLKLLTQTAEDNERLRELLAYEKPPQVFDVSVVHVPSVLAYPRYRLSKGSLDPSIIATQYSGSSQHAFLPTVDELAGEKPDQPSIVNRNLLLRNMRGLPAEIRDDVSREFAETFTPILKGTYLFGDPQVDQKQSLPLHLAYSLLEKRLEASGLTTKQIDAELRRIEQSYEKIQMPDIPLLEAIYQHAMTPAGENDLQRVESEVQQYPEGNVKPPIRMEEHIENSKILAEVRTHDWVQELAQLKAQSQPSTSKEVTKAEPFIYIPDDPRSLQDIYADRQQRGEQLEQSNKNRDLDMDAGSPLIYYSRIVGLEISLDSMLEYLEDHPDKERQIAACRKEYQGYFDTVANSLQYVKNESFRAELTELLQQTRERLGI